MRFLISGHTGFKGSWLALWLAERGHSVHGLALAPEPGSLYERASVGRIMASSRHGDIRNSEAVREAVRACRPEVVLHLAAQPLVRESYRDPRGTFETNSVGTLNVLEAVGTADSVRAQVIVTTDKVYRNVDRSAGYVESDALGGDDPYSASKAMADILTTSWVGSLGGPPTAIARAGNVIGGGDTGSDRLMPDILESCRVGKTLTLRNPESTRPWQHVLDCLNGYLLLTDHLLSGSQSSSNYGAWNFGPDAANCLTVREVAMMTMRLWGVEEKWVGLAGDGLHEAAHLTLDSRKSRSFLGWSDHLSLDEAIGWTVDWHRRTTEGADPFTTTLDQISEFESREVLRVDDIIDRSSSQNDQA